eukprot:jgi/Ulvmu1/9072/UM005_0167.1
MAMICFTCLSQNHAPCPSRQTAACATVDRRGALIAATCAPACTLLEQRTALADVAASAPALVPKRELAEGLMVSEVVKGNWQLSGGHKGSQSDDRTSGKKAVEDIDKFVSAGITTMDTADIYGPSEKLIGDYIRSRPQGREGLEILTKFCKFGNEQITINQKSVTQGIKRSLDNLGVDSVEMVQFYWHNYQVPKYVATSQYLMEEVAAGRVQNLGVTNFDVPRLQQMMSGGAKIVSNQVQYSLLDRRVDNGMLEYCETGGIKLLPFGTVAGGFLSEKYLGVPVEKISLDTYSKSKYASIIQQNGGWAWFQTLLSTLGGIARKHGTSIANVSSRWVLDKPAVAGVIVGARNARHVADHTRLATLQLDADDLGRIEEVLEQARQPEGDIYTWERGGQW